MKIFRKLRWRNLPDTKLTRYLLYATGEIILVVIGILIALQINTWSETRKKNESIRGHLVILRQNLQEDQAQLQELVLLASENIDYADSALRQIRTEIPMNSNTKKYLVKLILEFRFRPNKNAMDMLEQSNELPLLGHSLQTAILNYYSLIESTQERELISNTQIQTKYESHINENYTELFQKDNSWEFLKEVYKDDPRPVKELSAAKLTSDGKLEAMILSRYFQSIQLHAFYEDLQHASGELIRLTGGNSEK